MSINRAWILKQNKYQKKTQDCLEKVKKKSKKKLKQVFNFIEDTLLLGTIVINYLSLLHL